MSKSPSKFRSNSGKFLTVALFHEISRDRDRVLYTFNHEDLVLEDGTVIPSLYRLYLAYNDTSEYSFANDHFESWTHWCVVREAFKDIIDPWSRELELRLRKECLDRVKEAAENGSLEANKFLLNANFVKGIPEGIKVNPKNLAPKNPRGRPSNKPEGPTESEDEANAKDDLKRLREMTQGKVLQ